MRPRSLALLAALVLGLGAFIFFVERDLPSSEERAERAKKILLFEDEEIDALTLRPEGAAAAIELVRGEPATADLPPAASRWQLVAPVEAAADDGAVDRLLSTLRDLEKRRTVEDMPRQDAGLDPPRATLTLGRGGETTTLEIGAEVPGSETMLVAIDGRDEVYVVADALLDQLAGEVEAWRNRRLFPARREDIESVRLVHGEEVVVLSFAAEEAWLEEPLRDRAERDLTNQLLQTLVGLEARTFLDGEGAKVGAAAGGLVEVGLAGREESLRIELGAGAGSDVDGEEVEARVDGVAVRLAGLGEVVRRSAEAWRAHEVLALPVYRVDRVEIGEGSEVLELSRQGGDWLRGEERISFAAIDGLLDVLDELRAIGFAPVAGLREHEPELTFSLSEDTSDGPIGTSELRFLASDGGEVLVLVDGRPDALRLDPGSLASLRTKIEEIRSAEPLPAEVAEADEGFEEL